VNVMGAAEADMVAWWSWVEALSLVGFFRSRKWVLEVIAVGGEEKSNWIVDVAEGIRGEADACLQCLTGLVG